MLEQMNNLTKQKRKGTIPGKKLYKHGYTGEGDDKPGPQVYDPADHLVRSKSQSALFSRSKSIRETFNDTSDKNSGPGVYAYNVVD